MIDAQTIYQVAVKEFWAQLLNNYDYREQTPFDLFGMPATYGSGGGNVSHVIFEVRDQRIVISKVAVFHAVAQFLYGKPSDEVLVEIALRIGTIT